ncbi:TPA: protein tyrosine phosphatase, partial [Klebsiella pneumoniae]|nr:protein tyrosine phosphatase [Klebsiella pneumoniae]
IGERYLQKLLPNKRIESAGTSALIDHEADNSAIKVAAEHGISLAGHKGRQYTSSLGRQYDLILVMEKYHLEKIGQISPEARGKTMLFGHWLNQRDIPDPYRKSDEAFKSVLQLIEEAGQLWVRKLDV